MILLDAYALIAFLMGEAAAHEVEELLQREDAAIPAVNLAESVDVVCRVHGLRESDVRVDLEPLLTSRALSVLIADRETAWRAAEIRIRRYRRRGAELSLGDCFLLAAAGPGDTIATADPAVVAVARQVALRVIALPDSRGRRP